MSALRWWPRRGVRVGAAGPFATGIDCAFHFHESHGRETPATPTSAPLQPTPINDANASPLSIYSASSNLVTPYIQNWNVSLGRELIKGLVLDVQLRRHKAPRLIRAPIR